MRIKALTICIAAAAGSLMQACSFIPEFRQPAMPVPAQWHSGAVYSDTGDNALQQIGWKDFFIDPALQELVDIALQNNRDLRTAALQVESYQALYRIQRADLFPTLDVTGSGSRQRLPADLSPAGRSTISSNYNIGLGTTAWELDFFGRIRSLQEQALNQYLASDEARRSVQISLVTSVAIGWLSYCSDLEQLQLTNSTLRSYIESYELMQMRANAGTASDLDVAQAKSTVDSARSIQAQYMRLIAMDRNALEELLGTAIPEDILKQRSMEGSLLKDIPVGLPADLLVRRPDIRQAEYQLRAANANIGAARAAFFPRISLTTSAGTASDELSGLFDAGSGAWSFMPQISVPIFTAGRLSANLDYAELQKDINVAFYEKTIQTAFREVSDGLAQRKTYALQLLAEQDLVDTNQHYLNLANERYDSGVDNYLTVLDAQRVLFSARQQQILTRLNKLSTEITLFKALGGGITVDEPESLNTRTIATGSTSTEPAL